VRFERVFLTLRVSISTGEAQSSPTDQKPQPAPGKNGPIAFRRYFDDQQTWGAMFTVQPDGPPDEVEAVGLRPDWGPARK
jgi:hypothetical protein